MTEQGPQTKLPSDEELRRTVDRVLGRASTEGSGLLDQAARELSQNQPEHSIFDGDQQDLEERRALRRVAGLSTELDDVTEVEYRQLRLERFCPCCSRQGTRGKCA